MSLRQVTPHKRIVPTQWETLEQRVMLNAALVVVPTPPALPVAATATADPPPPAVPGEFQCVTDATLTTPGLVGPYIDQKLQGDPGQNDWRMTQAIAGTRVDPSLTFINDNWGKRADVGLTH